MMKTASDIPNLRTGADGRMAKRTSVMLRCAKVVCQSGEYVAIIRDVSELGVGLSFLHETPPEARILLELSNGATYPIERAWMAKRRGGYEFASAIDVDEFIQESSEFSHRPIRLRIAALAHVFDGKKNVVAGLCDLSRDGASFECEIELDQSAEICLSLSGLGQKRSRVRWNKDLAYGIQFDEPVSIEDFAKVALKLQPFLNEAVTEQWPRLPVGRVA